MPSGSDILNALNPFARPEVKWNYNYEEPENNPFYRTRNNQFAEMLAQQAAEGGLGISDIRGRRAIEGVGQQAQGQEATLSRGNAGLAAALAAKSYGPAAQQAAYKAAQSRLSEAQQANQAYMGYLSDADKAKLARAAINNQQRIQSMNLRAKREGWTQDTWNTKVGGLTNAMGSASSLMTRSEGSNNSGAGSNTTAGGGYN